MEKENFEISKMSITELYCYYKFCIMLRAKNNKTIRAMESNYIDDGKFIIIENLLTEEINNRLNKIIDA